VSQIKQAGKQVGIQLGVVRRTRTEDRTWQISQRKGAISGAAAHGIVLRKLHKLILGPCTLVEPGSTHHVAPRTTRPQY
jgi:hypothetical protein